MWLKSSIQVLPLVRWSLFLSDLLNCTISSRAEARRLAKLTVCSTCFAIFGKGHLKPIPHFDAFNVLINAQLSNSHRESTFQQVVSSSVRELTARCPSSISLQAFQIPMLPKAVIYCWDTAELIDRFCSLRGMSKDWWKIKVRIDYGKLFLKVSLTMTGEYCNDFESRQ